MLEKDIDLTALCRVCMQQPEPQEQLDMQLIYDEDDQLSYSDCFTYCTDIILATEQKSGRPHSLCKGCGLELQIAYDFRKKVETSKRFFNGILVSAELPKNNGVDQERKDEIQNEKEEEKGDRAVPVAFKEEKPLNINHEINTEDHGEVFEVFLEYDDQEMEELDDNNAVAAEEYLQDDVSAASQYTTTDVTEFGSDGFEPESFCGAEEDADTNADANNGKIVKDEVIVDMSEGENEIVHRRTLERQIANVYMKRKPGRPRLRADNQGKQQPFICTICGNVYADRVKLQVHVKIHTQYKPHECEICLKRFAQTPQLARHMNSHTGNRPYKCKQCSASFADPSTCYKHERIHTNERPFKCNICDKSFSYSNVLKVHMMWHTGEKPYSCLYCDKRFTQQHHMKAHQRTHKP